MTGFVSSPNRFQNFHINRSSKGCFENGLVRGTGTFAMQIVGFCRPVLGCGAVTPRRNFAKTDMNCISFFPGFKVRTVSFNQFIHIALAFFGNVVFELVTVKAPTATSGE